MEINSIYSFCKQYGDTLLNELGVFLKAECIFTLINVINSCSESTS